MSSAGRSALRRKYLSLGLGELTASVGFAFLAVMVVTPRLGSAEEIAALWCGLGPLLIILWQAAAYWLLARRWVSTGAMPGTVARVFRTARVLNIGLLAVGLVGLGLWLPDRVGVALLLIAVWSFGLIEYLNYFVVRLAYPLGRWATMVRQGRTPQIVKDLRSAGA